MAYRISGPDGTPLLDLLVRLLPGSDVPADAPAPGQRVLCRHPFEENKRAYAIPAKVGRCSVLLPNTRCRHPLACMAWQVEPLHRLYWDCGRVARPLPSLSEIQEYVQQQIRVLRPFFGRCLSLEVGTGTHSIRVCTRAPPHMSFQATRPDHLRKLNPTPYKVLCAREVMRLFCCSGLCLGRSLPIYASPLAQRGSHSNSVVI